MTIEERANELTEKVWGNVYGCEDDTIYGILLYALQKERSVAQMEIDVLEAEVDRLRREIEVYKKAIKGKI